MRLKKGSMQSPNCKLRHLIGCGLLLTLVNVFAQAQKANDYCEPSPAIKAALKKISEAGNGSLPFRLARERKLEELRTLLKQYPDDLFVHRRYQDTYNDTQNRDPEPLIEEYRARLGNHSDDLVSQYLYGNLLIGIRTKEAITLMENALKGSPSFSPAHQGLFQAYQVPVYRDKTKAQEYLTQAVNVCSSTLASYYLLTDRQVDDPVLLRTAAQKLRVLLEKRVDKMDADDLAYYDVLWQLEFRINPIAEHPRVRQQVEADVQRLRGISAAQTERMLDVLRSGYVLAGNKEGERWAEEELARRFPRSRTAARLAQARWNTEHPFPRDGTPEKKLAYFEALFSATDNWVRQWPNNLSIRLSRFSAAGALPRVTDSELDKIIDDLLLSLDVNAGERTGTPPFTTLVANVYLKRNLHLDRVPELVQRGLNEKERIYRLDQQSEWNSSEAKEGVLSENVKYTRRISWPMLLDAYLRLNQPDKAREVLAQRAVALAKEKPSEAAKPAEKIAYANSQAAYWEWMGRVAEHEQRKLDALTCYQNALTFRPSPEKKGENNQKPDELTERTHKLWQAIGGTEEGWKAWLARNEAPKTVKEVLTTSGWEERNKPLPVFTITDLQGRKWQLDDLKGKVAFINLWATWCGPCRMELPYVQKLHDQLKDRKDVLVLTLNVDEEQGQIEPFIKEHKYTFPVLPALSYVEGLLQFINIPRNWIVGADGVWQVEQIGFEGEGDKWMRQTLEAIEKARGAK